MCYHKRNFNLNVLSSTLQTLDPNLTFPTNNNWTLSLLPCIASNAATFLDKHCHIAKNIPAACDSMVFNGPSFGALNIIIITCQNSISEFVIHALLYRVIANTLDVDNKIKKLSVH